MAHRLQKLSAQKNVRLNEWCDIRGQMVPPGERGKMNYAVWAYFPEESEQSLQTPVNVTKRYGMRPGGNCRGPLPCQAKDPDSGGDQLAGQFSPYVPRYTADDNTGGAL